MANNKDDRFKEYPETDLFKIIDTISLPHPFCIGPQHVGHASDNFTGMLSKDAIQDYEDKHDGKPSCKMKGCNLSFAEHKTALVVQVKNGVQLNDVEAELKTYLLKCNPICLKDGYNGYAFHQVKKDQDMTIH